MKTLWILILSAWSCAAALPPGVTGKMIFQYPNAPVPLQSYLVLEDPGNGNYIQSSLGQVFATFGGTINNTNFALLIGLNATNFTLETSNLLYQQIVGSTNLGFILNFNGNGTNTTNWGVSSYEEIDALRLYGTNFFTFKTNAPYLKTDGDGLLSVGDVLQGTNLYIIAGANISFSTNAGGGVTITGSSTNFTQVTTNNTFVNTNLFISTSNAYFNILYATNSYFDTNFVTNLFFVSGKGNTVVITNVFVAEQGVLVNSNSAINSAIITDNKHAYTNAVNAHGVFTNSATGPPSFGLVQNTELLNSSLTVAGTANQVTVSGGGPVSLGGTATLSLPDPLQAPGKVSANIITNRAFAATGVVTNDANGKEYTTPTLENALLANSSITIQGSAVALGGSTLAVGSSPTFNLVNSTNLIYRYTTNAIPNSIVLTFGQAFSTNISTADITVTAVNVQDLAAYETCILSLTNSSGTDFKVTLPNGIRGTPGSGTPPVFYCTNKFSCDVFISHYGNQRTNAWKIDWAP